MISERSCDTEVTTHQIFNKLYLKILNKTVILNGKNVKYFFSISADLVSNFFQ